MSPPWPWVKHVTLQAGDLEDCSSDSGSSDEGSSESSADSSLPAVHIMHALSASPSSASMEGPPHHLPAGIPERLPCLHAHVRRACMRQASCPGGLGSLWVKRATLPPPGAATTRAEFPPPPLLPRGHLQASQLSGVCGLLHTLSQVVNMPDRTPSRPAAASQHRRHSMLHRTVSFLQPAGGCRPLSGCP